VNLDDRDLEKTVDRINNDGVGRKSIAREFFYML